MGFRAVIRGRLIGLSLSLAALLPAGAGQAADDGLRRMVLRQDQLGWEAVGYLDIGGRGFCTGTLVSPDVVLTAAHCLVDRATGKRHAPRTVRFLAGLRGGEVIVERRGQVTVIHPRYQVNAPEMITRVRHDVALLKLDRPIPVTEASPIVPGSKVKPGDRVSVVSYARGREDAPSIQRSCRVLERYQGVLMMSCLSDFGASGSPVMTIRDGRKRIVSIISSGTDDAGERLTFGMDIEQPLADLMAALRTGQAVDSGARRQLGAKRLKTGSRTKAASGAKFLRP